MSHLAVRKKNDFGKGPVWRRIIAQAVPLTLAQLVQLLYNVVDRVYIGRLNGEDSLALTGVGLSFPIITLIIAFAALFGVGGVPLFSMEHGAGNTKKAQSIMGNSFALLLISGGVLTVLGLLFLKPLLYAFGASDASFIYAKEYLSIYLLGTVFSVVNTGMNGYINAQGFPKIGMLSVIIGAVLNIALDPIFIFTLGMGVGGAALATIISQGVSAIWVIAFLFSKKAVIRLESGFIKIDKLITKDITKLGTSNFIMQGTNCLVQVVCNASLQNYGGDIYVGIMTVATSVREVLMLPVMGIVNGAGPVISYNYGAKNYKRTKQGIDFNTFIGSAYTMLAWGLVLLFPTFWFNIFTSDAKLIENGIQMLIIYFFGFVFMSFQFAGQSTFQAVGDAKHAIFFSLLRKAIIVVPLTLILPIAGFGVKGVFLAEPISNIIGGIACFVTMRLTVYKKIKQKIKKSAE